MLLANASSKHTLDIEREVDPCAHPCVLAANEALKRIEGHRRLFRADWLPFLDGVFHLSLIAWERTGPRTNSHGKPDWTNHSTQAEFRKLTKDLPWAHYIQERRPLLTVLRRIGENRERFLAWYEGLEESVRERVGHPETLWRSFENESKKPDPDVEDDHNNNQRAASTDSTNDSTNESTNDSAAEKHTKQVNARGAAAKAAKPATIRSDDDRIAQLVVKNEHWQHFGVKLCTSIDSGESTLKTGLREDLDRLLEDDASDRVAANLTDLGGADHFTKTQMEGEI